MQSFKRLVRFVPRSDPSRVLLGQPQDSNIDVGAAVYKGRDVAVRLWSGSSVLAPGEETNAIESIGKLLSPLEQSEVGTIRCIGLNYLQHAAEVRMDIPKIPTVFLKPNTSLASPWPEPSILPRITQVDDCGDYESELVVVIGRTAKNVAEADAMDYVLGYTASNDISSRTSQLAQSQWSFSKGFDSACPIGPVIVSTALIPDPQSLRIRGLLNERVMQDCGLNDLIFTIPELVSYLSQGTTLPPGTIILTGTPAGVGFTQDPPVRLRDGDEFSVEILPHIGTLVNKFQNED